MVDLTKGTRTYTESYALSTPAGVKKLLRDRHKIGSRRFSGDTAASDILLDLHSAIESAGLTDRMAEAVAYVYGLDTTQGQAAKLLGVTREAVKDLLFQATKRIAAVYRRWNYDEVTVELTYEESEGVSHG
jgi:DNA-directed RNA polymerase specialized sigma24 family protein